MEDGPDDIVSGRESIIKRSMSVGRSVWYRIRIRWLCLRLAAVAASRTCGHADETTGWMWPGLALAGGRGTGVPR